MVVNKPKYIGDVTGLQFRVEALLLLLVLVGLRTMPCQRLRLRIKFQMLEFAPAQFDVEGAPLRVEFDEQGIQRFIDRPPQPRNVQCFERIGLGLHGYQIIGKAPVLHAVVKVDVTGVETLAQLSVYPEFIAVATQSDGLAMRVKAQ